MNAPAAAYEPLRVRAYLAAPVMFDRWQPLDGILSAISAEDPEFRERERRYRFYRRALEAENAPHPEWRLPADEFYRQRYGEEPPAQPPHFLPLAIWGHGLSHGLWVYCSSWAAPAEHEQDTVYFTRRIDFEAVDAWVRPEGRVMTAKGEFAAKYLPYQTIVTDTLTWWIVGQRAEVEARLQFVLAIGKKRRRGYGAVRRWEVTPAAEDRSVIAPDGVIMRPVPVELLDRLGRAGPLELAYTTYRPPYWSPQYAARCAVAGRLN